MVQVYDGFHGRMLVLLKVQLLTETQRVQDMLVDIQ